jgi:hypothetical protein
MALTLVALLGFGIGGTSALDAFFYLATIGTLSVLVVYVVVSVSAARLELQSSSWLRVILPLGGALVALYVLYRNLIPAPAFPYNLFPYIVAGWLVLGLSLALAVPEVRRRVSAGLAAR